MKFKKYLTVVMADNRPAVKVVKAVNDKDASTTAMLEVKTSTGAENVKCLVASKQLGEALALVDRISQIDGENENSFTLAGKLTDLIEEAKEVMEADIIQEESEPALVEFMWDSGWKEGVIIETGDTHYTIEARDKSIGRAGTVRIPKHNVSNPNKAQAA